MSSLNNCIVSVRAFQRHDFKVYLKGCQNLNLNCKKKKIVQNLMLFIDHRVENETENNYNKTTLGNPFLLYGQVLMLTLIVGSSLLGVIYCYPLKLKLDKPCFHYYYNFFYCSILIMKRKVFNLKCLV